MFVRWSILLILLLNFFQSITSKLPIPFILYIIVCVCVFVCEREREVLLQQMLFLCMNCVIEIASMHSFPMYVIYWSKTGKIVSIHVAPKDVIPVHVMPLKPF